MLNLNGMCLTKLLNEECYQRDNPGRYMPKILLKNIEGSINNVEELV
jgi:hypothetical protein